MELQKRACLCFRPRFFWAGLAILTLLILSSCEDDSRTEEIEEDENGITACETPEVETSDDDCNIVLDGCDDERLHELLCAEVENGDGTYRQRLICNCAEDQAVHGATILEGHSCSSIGNAIAGNGDSKVVSTIEAGFRACGLELSVTDTI